MSMREKKVTTLSDLPEIHRNYTVKVYTGWRHFKMSPLGSRGPYSTREPSKAHCIQHCNCKTMNPAYTISSASRRCFVVAETPLLPILVSLGAHGEAPTSLSLSPETEDWQRLVASLSRKTYSHARSSSSKGLGTVPPSVVTTTEIPSTKTIRETIKRI